MAHPRPAHCYRNVTGPAYTRRKYMGGVPGDKLVQFDIGNIKGEFPMEMVLTVNEACQIRNIALDAARVSIVKCMEGAAGAAGFHLKVNTHPYHVLRENKQAQGAGADRVSDGMRLSFGKCIGTAARVKVDQVIFTLRFNKANIENAKEAMRKGSSKIPSPCKFKLTKGAEQ
jgi:large subunit ribosomal protein L10e